MQEKSLIKKKILKYLECKGISKYEFYKITGITRGVLDQNNGMSEENTARFLAIYGNEVTADWLFKSNENASNYDFKSIPVQLKKTSPIEYDNSHKGNPFALVLEKNERILSMKETIETQRKYILHLEEENARLKDEKEKPAEGGQKRKAV
jgi:hypothetical protein